MQETTKTATLIEVYDPAMCCSTGVCGSDVDDALVDFANDVKWLKAQGVEVVRFNLGQEPEAFKKSPQILTRLQTEGSACLPIIMINGEIVAESGYPDRAQISSWIGLATVGQTVTKIGTNGQKTDFLQQLEAAVAEADENKLRAVFLVAEEAGLDKQAIATAMQKGLNKRIAETNTIVKAANEVLGIPQSACAPGGGCC
ncbi:MAG: arsenite efflux transporter metallochaperone ArsD [Balneolales bacterium]|nr:arsenite efflux transporter metallochaperone ArsD [Balneolales bacterium]